MLNIDVDVIKNSLEDETILSKFFKEEMWLKIFWF